MKKNNKKSIKKSKKGTPKKKQIKKIKPKITIPFQDIDLKKFPEFEDIEASKIKIKEKKEKKETPSMYWTPETEKNIIKYNQTTDQSEKNKIYENDLKYAFEKLVENVIHTYKFTYFETSLEDAKKECLTHLLANIHRFTKEKGAGKSFGYFSVTSKNYFILINNSNHKKWKVHDNIDPTPENPKEFVVDDHVKQKINDKKEFINLMIEYWEKNITKIFTKQRDIQIAYAIIELFRKCDLDSYNKKALYLYIRGQHECKTQQITKIINKMKVYQKSIMNEYLEHGKILNKSDITIKRMDSASEEENYDQLLAEGKGI